MRIALRLLVALLIGGTCLSVRADERIKVHEENADARLAAAYARAVGVKPLDLRSGDQVRIWFEGLMSGDVEGHLLARGRARTCTLTTEYHAYENDDEGQAYDPVVIVHKGRCKSITVELLRIEDAMRHLPEALEFNGQEFDCPDVEDGWSGIVEGVVGGERFTFSLSNVNFCMDEERFKPLAEWLRVFEVLYRDPAELD